MITPRLALLLPMAAWTLVASAAADPSYPNKPVRLVTSEIGGSADAGARLLALGLSGRLGQQVIVDNRGSGVIPGDIVARSRPDGYTLLFFGGTFWLQPLLRKNVPYDPIRDFAPVTLAVISPTVLVVHPSVPAHSVKELIALAKARPGELNYAMAASGLPGYESVSTTALFAPARTPPAIIERLNRESVRYFATPEAKERFMNTGAEAVGSSPEELGARVKSEIERMGKVIRSAGIRAE